MGTKPVGAVEQTQLLCLMRASILYGVSSLLATIDRETSDFGLRVECSSTGCSMQLNGIFLKSGVRGMLKRNDRREVCMQFSIIKASINRAICIQKGANVTGVHGVYSDIVSKLVSQIYSGGYFPAEIEKLRREVGRFRHKVVNMFSPSAHPH